MNISQMTNKSRKEYAYVMIDVEAEVTQELEEKLNAIEGVLKVRVIK